MVAQSLPAEQVYTKPRDTYKPLRFDKPELGISETEREGGRYVVIDKDSPLIVAAETYKNEIAAIITNLQERSDELSVNIVEPTINDAPTFWLDVLDDTPVHPFLHIGNNILDLDFVNWNIPDRFAKTIITVAEESNMPANELYEAVAPFFAYYEENGLRYIMCLKLN